MTTPLNENETAAASSPAGPGHDAMPRRAATRPRRIAAYVVIALVAGVVVYGWGTSTSEFFGAGSVDGELVSYTVPNATHVSVQYDVIKPKNKIAKCELVAADSDHNTVADVFFTVPKGTSDETKTILIGTSKRTSSVDLAGCSLTK